MSHVEIIEIRSKKCFPSRGGCLNTGTESKEGILCHGGKKEVVLYTDLKRRKEKGRLEARKLRKDQLLKDITYGRMNLEFIL